MHYSFNHPWQIHRPLRSKHIIICARCRQNSFEAGVLEAFTVQGTGYFRICKECLGEFILFVTNKGGQMYGNDDPDFGVLALLNDDDMDIAEHHPTCECQECMTDGDAHRKFLLENNHDFFEQIYKSA